MADLATPSAAQIGTMGAGAQNTDNASKDKAAPVAKPERPDDEAYKGELAKAEKELRTSEDRMVCLLQCHVVDYVHLVAQDCTPDTRAQCASVS